MNILSFLLPIILHASVYSLLSLGLKIQLGYGGMINFGVVAYAAVGA